MRKIFGIKEVAEEIKKRPKTVAMWRHRGRLPEPDAVLACGPIWLLETIRPFIRRQKYLSGLGKRSC